MLRECFIKKGLDNGNMKRETWNVGGEEYWFRVWKSVFSFMNRSVIVPDDRKHSSSKGTLQSTIKKNQKNNGHLQFICWEAHLVAVFSCPSVYLSFIPEAWTAGKWINKDWAKIGSGCVCSWGMLASSALTAILSRRTEWREGAAELAGR